MNQVSINVKIRIAGICILMYQFVCLIEELNAVENVENNWKVMEELSERAQ